MSFSNLPFIPSFHEEELFISHYSRFAKLAARNDLEELISVLNGKENDLPKRELFSLYLKQLLKNGIKLPELFLTNSIESLNFAIGRGFSRDYMVKSLLSTRPKYRYCDDCIRHDLELYGDIYLRRHHQVPVVLVCDRHGSELRETLTASKARGDFILPSVTVSAPPDNPVILSDLLINVSSSIRLAYGIKNPLPGGYYVLKSYLTSVMVYQAIRGHGLSKECSAEIESRLREDRFEISFVIGTVREKSGTSSVEIIRSVRRQIVTNLDEILLFASALGVGSQSLKILKNERLLDSERWIKNIPQPSYLKLVGGGKFDLIIPFSQKNGQNLIEQYLSISEADQQIVGIKDRAPNAKGMRVYGVPIEPESSFIVLRFGSNRSHLWSGQLRQEAI